MAKLIGVIGFICGFCAGQMLLYFMLRHKTKEQLKTDKSLKIYGVLNWLVAALGATAFVFLYRKYYSM